MVKGFIINKFRGDPSLLGSGLDQLKQLTGVTVIGVMPYLTDVYVPEEDSPLAARGSAASTDDDRIDVAVVGSPRIANFDEFDLYEFDPWARISGVRLRYVREASDFGRPDLVILPDSKVTVADLEFVRQSGFESKIRRHVWDGRALMGICGEMQMLGDMIRDPLGIESDQVEVQGLGILDVDTEFVGDKLTTRTDASVVADIGLLAGTRGVKVSGCEIHVGVSVSRGGAIEAVKSLRTNRGVGYLDSIGRVFGTYMHDLFKNEELTDRVVNNLARMKGIERLVEPVPFSQDAEFDKLVAHLRRHIDFAAVYESMSLSASVRSV